MASDDFYALAAKNKHRATPLGLFAELMKQTFSFIKDVNEKNRERNQRLDKLEKRLTAQDERNDSHERRIESLETKALRGVEYKDIWREGIVYQRGVLVTHQSSLWLSLTDTKARPPHDTWKLVVRRGAHE